MGPSNELPTIELCRVLTSLIGHAKSKKLCEVGAGAGLLSKMLKYHLSLPIRATDKFPPPFAKQAYVPIYRESFAEVALGPGEDIIVSWLHPDVEEEFLEMVDRNQPANVWHVGQLAGGQCFSHEFVARMGEMGYGYLPVPAKQVSHIDYFIEEEIADGITRTATAWFSREPFPVISDLCRREDLAVYRTVTAEMVRDYLARHYPEF